jgi:hypothetical protein
MAEDSRSIIQKALDKIRGVEPVVTPEPVLPELPTPTTTMPTPSTAMPAPLEQNNIPPLLREPVAPVIAPKPAQTLGAALVPPVQEMQVPSQAAAPLDIPVTGTQMQTPPMPEQPIEAPPGQMGLNEPSNEQVQAAIGDALSVPAAEPAPTPVAAPRKPTALETETIRASNMQQEILDQIKTLDDNFKKTLEAEKTADSSLRNRLITGLAVALGAVGQSLTGARSNVALDIINQEVEQRALRNKLNQQERESLRKALIDQGQIEIAKLANQTQNEYRKGMLKLQQDQLEIEKQNALQKQAALAMNNQQSASKWSGLALTPEQEATLSAGERQHLVVLPGNKKVLAQTKDQAKQLFNDTREVTNALDAVNQMIKIGKKGNKFAFFTEDKARLQPLTGAIVGALRIPYQGPGPLTDTERNNLLAMLGRPLDVFTIKSLELAKLNQIKHDLQTKLERSAEAAGVREKVLPDNKYIVPGQKRPVTETELLQKYQQKYPNATPEDLLISIRRNLVSE